MHERRRAVAVGLAAAGIIWLWQFLTVRYNYGGDWTALFRIGPIASLPPFAASERHYMFPASDSFDGQWYHLMAHDPFMSRGAASVIDSPVFRYRRILVSLLAWMLALGRDAWIDRAYLAVILAFVFLGAFWMARVAAHRGVDPAWGLAFAIMPGTICSADSMTVDVALAALIAGFAWYAYTGSRWKLAIVLMCAALTREVAFPLIGGYTLFLLWKRRFADAAGAAASALPALLWFAFLMRHTASLPVRDYMSWIPMSGWLNRVLHPTVILDYAALAGILWTFAAAARMTWTRRTVDEVAGVYSLGLFFAFLNGRQIWDSVGYGAGRVLTPFLLITAIAELSGGPWLALGPILLVDARLSLDLAPQIVGVARGLLH
jgi:hypothetical protein